jgi:ABC-2 type transport system ATP-binding protein
MFLAVPFILRRPLVILDEPTIRLDVSTRNRVQQTLREILNRRQGTTVLLATHDMNEAERLCDRIGIIDQGRPMTRDDAKRLALVQTALTGFDPPPTLSRNSELDAKLQDGLQSFTIGISKTGNEADSGHLILAILQSLASVGLPPKQITVEEPSLEEAFMDVIGQAQCRPKPEEFKEDALDAVQQISNRFFPW